MQMHQGLAVPALTGAVFFCSRADETAPYIDRLAAGVWSECSVEAGRARPGTGGRRWRTDASAVGAPGGETLLGQHRRRLVSDTRAIVNAQVLPRFSKRGGEQFWWRV